MNEILSTAIALLSLVAAFAGLASWVRRDTLTARQFRLPATDLTVEPDRTPVGPTSPKPAQQTVRTRRTGVLQVN